MTAQLLWAGEAPSFALLTTGDEKLWPAHIPSACPRCRCRLLLYVPIAVYRQPGGKLLAYHRACLKTCAP